MRILSIEVLQKLIRRVHPYRMRPFAFLAFAPPHLNRGQRHRPHRGGPTACLRHLSAGEENNAKKNSIKDE